MESTLHCWNRTSGLALKIKINHTMNKLKALLIGKSKELTLAPMQLLKRAGFKIDLISIGFRCHAPNPFRKCIEIESIDQLTSLLPTELDIFSYNLIVVGDDDTLQEIRRSNLPKEAIGKMLPVRGDGKSAHIYSKTELSKLLEAQEIATPPYKIVTSENELLACAQLIGYPLLAKIDGSGGGAGVYECHSDPDLLSKKEKYSYPLLLQKLIDGYELDLSSFYQNGQLVYFSYSIPKKSISKYGPSCLREYVQLSNVDSAVYAELQSLGIALGAHGFVNVAAICSDLDGKRYYFEADMRPIAWADYGKFIGNDAAVALREYFYNKNLSFPPAENPNYPASLLIPYYKRLTFFELLTNRFDCWDFLPENKTILNVILTSGLNKSATFAGSYLRPWMPNHVWLTARLFYRKTCHWLNLT